MLFGKIETQEFSIQNKRNLETKLSPWQHPRVHHLVSFLKYNYGAKFQSHCLIIFRDIVDFVF